jgi:recombinational DNA repair ATPase RecF
MIQVDALTIKEFRGIRDLTLNLKGNNFAVCGHNGTGKSGIVDAIEFALTGNISRLVGKGTGGISLKEHAPHVDSRTMPDKARVVMTVFIPSLNKKVTIDRNVKDATLPTITPNDKDVLEVLNHVSLHPEFVLSRRELIRYVLSTPGDRAKEVQVLLRLEQVEDIRTVLQKISNSCKKELIPLTQEKTQAHEQLLSGLEILQLSPAKLLEAVNARRLLLELNPIKTLESDTSIKDGLIVAKGAVPKQTIPKIQAIADIKKTNELVRDISSPETISLCKAINEELTALNLDPIASQGVKKEQFLQSALALIDGEACPVCDTSWNSNKLKSLINEKLKHFEEVTKKRVIVEKQLEPVKTLLRQFQDTLSTIHKYGALANITSIQKIQTFISSLGLKRQQLESFLPIEKSIATLQNITVIPKELLSALTDVEKYVAAIPDPTKQDAARDYLTIGQERLEKYRNVLSRLKRAEERAALTLKIYETYAQASTKVLDGVYKKVEKDFSSLYREINVKDEEKFDAHLTPSMGKLGFDVNFYGRGYFPPGAYHSEGHQDSMGLCLYLALMRHLLGDSFKFAVLDDVLMSIDTGHRREVCNLLKKQFPKTQFILTTHDDVWLRHMKTAGLISQGSSVLFRKWNVDQGPTEWDQRDIWKEIDDEVQNNNIRAASALLRNFMEYISSEICNKLRAKVEFRADNQFQLGDLLPRAVGQFKELLCEAEDSARSWGKTKIAGALAKRKKDFGSIVNQSNVENWQINPAVHYNEWANLCKEDFAPVVEAQRKLIESFFCPECNTLFHVIPERGQREAIKCDCAFLNVNLQKKKLKKLTKGSKNGKS